MKIKFIGTVTGPNFIDAVIQADRSKIQVPVDSPKYDDYFRRSILAMTQKIMWLAPFTDADWNKQITEPVELHFATGDSLAYWIFKRSIVAIADADLFQREDIRDHIKLFIYKREDKFSKISKEVKRFEQFAKIKPIYREQIAEEVR